MKVDLVAISCETTARLLASCLVKYMWGEQMQRLGEKSLNLGKTIAEQRKKLGWTQSQLAEFLGVTKASVSKWETEQTRPDIMLLPELATLFNITIDELLSYESQLTKRQINHIYENLWEVRDQKGLIHALDELEVYLRKYGNCIPFLFSLIQWLINAGVLAAGEMQEKCLHLAEDLIGRVRYLTKEPSEADLAQVLEATLQMLQGDYDAVAENKTRVLSFERFALDELYLAALAASGQQEEAITACQILLFLYLSSTLSVLVLYMELCWEDSSRIDTLVHLGKAIMKLAKFEQFPSNQSLGFYLQGANCYGRRGEREETLSMLELFAEQVEGLNFPLSIGRLAFFDRVGDWLAEQRSFLETSPVSEANLKPMILETVLTNPAFEFLQEDQTYQELIKRLERKLEVE